MDNAKEINECSDELRNLLRTSGEVYREVRCPEHVRLPILEAAEHVFLRCRLLAAACLILAFGIWGVVYRSSLKKEESISNWTFACGMSPSLPVIPSVVPSISVGHGMTIIRQQMIQIEESHKPVTFTYPRRPTLEMMYDKNERVINEHGMRMSSGKKKEMV